MKISNSVLASLAILTEMRRFWNILSTLCCSYDYDRDFCELERMHGCQEGVLKRRDL